MNKLAKLLASPGIVVAPGCYDAFSALMAERAGFAALYVSGASIAYARLGRPDIGLFGLAELADTVAAIADRVSVPLIVDADTGFGNAINAQRTMRVLARAGAAAIQIEDQAMPKRCGHLRGKALIPKEEMAGKLRAAADARETDGPLLIARTDAIAVEGFESAMHRAEAYLAAGADILFVEAPRTEAELADVGQRFGARVPLLANMVEGGSTPVLPAKRLAELGFRISIFPGGTMRAVAHALDTYFASLARHGTTAPMRERMLDLAGINAILGLDAMLAEGARYDHG
ncbi:MAG: isocitrate lyase/phosphoenolpyruvate mutase family protein [Rhodospirillales bacterium]|nr:isocitrate lyase/phosphoenolpyruvate mutase family protein [Rhodospirillales bacterium]